MASRVVNITSPAQLSGLLVGDRISVIDFTAKWCGPCQMIAPVYERLSTEWGQAQFLKVDVDAQQQIAQSYSISAMPTFVFCKGSRQLEKMQGANQQGLQAMLEKHAGPPNPSASASASSGGGASTSGSEATLEGFTSLNGSLDLKQVSCLNEDSAHTLKDLLRNNGNGGGYLQSDADEQLILNIPLQSASKVRALRFKGTPEDQVDKAPKKIKIFVNQTTLGFEDAESLDPAHSETLTHDQALGKSPVSLRFVRFQSVNSLQIFVADNQGGDDVTRIYGVEVLGVEGERSDVKGLKKVDDDE